MTETLGGIEREWLAWFNEGGEPYGLPAVSRRELQREQLRAELTQQALEDQRRRAEEERLRAEKAEEQARKLGEYLRSLGIAPDSLPPGAQN